MTSLAYASGWWGFVRSLLDWRRSAADRAATTDRGTERNGTVEEAEDNERPSGRSGGRQGSVQAQRVVSGGRPVCGGGATGDRPDRLGARHPRLSTTTGPMGAV